MGIPTASAYEGGASAWTALGATRFGLYAGWTPDMRGFGAFWVG